MELEFRTNDPQAAARYFEAKASFSTGPMEVEHALTHGRKVGVDFNIIDVRTPDDYAEGHIPGATNLPEARWSSVAGLSPDRLNLLYCYSSVCHLAARAAVDFAKAGYPVMEIDGGFASWEEHGLDIERGIESSGEVRPGLKSTPPSASGDGKIESLL